MASTQTRSQAEPDTNDADATKAKRRGVLKDHLGVVTAGLGVFAAALTCVTAALTLRATSLTNERDDLAAELADLEAALREAQDSPETPGGAVTDDESSGEDRASSTTTSTDSSSTPSGGTPTMAEIAVSPDEVRADEDFVITVSGSGFEASERLRILIVGDTNEGSAEDGGCYSVEYTCTVLKDIHADANGAFEGVQINVATDGASATWDVGTAFILVNGISSGERATQPLRLT